MADTNETIADIIAEMRHKDTARRRFTLTDAFGGYETITIDRANTMLSLADRFDAAHKRENGNAAKLREAVVEIIDYLEPIRKWTAPSKENHTELTALFAAVDTVYTKAKAALAAPPRNCDRYATVDEAMDDFADEALIEQWNALKAGKDRDMLAVELFVFTKWLFVPATEKEGGAK